ncbi:penicillin-binding transpeptidase domain-containing protein [Alloacidobacterium sp.]|uniref:penicillin-binding transpeptidase domain-containing protein n=1 Tax=Alloacidobacterium sp. TaxID=2951999 RepID=UPI002D66ACAB|nr:penicillin-binding transpeptidase domain-containing protein [Alloacidobacterium sp.]HYK37208.1 penicillin-binding transpeptidase domain-containing protein [Alloacidobacterium sp.]
MKRIAHLVLLVGLVALPASLFAGDTTTTHHSRHTRAHVQESASAQQHISHLQHSRRTAHVANASLTTTTRHARVRRASLVHHRYYERFTGNSFADGSLTTGDVIGGEDQVVRQAAIDALGNMNGTVVAIDPSNGRILAMVNQKLALSSGAEPCSTIKLSVALAALDEGIVTKDTPVNLGGSYHMNLTEALAHSNNLYFETLGRRLGFERVRHYANQFGLGELAGYNIPNEQLGIYPDQELPESEGGVGRMCSFGEGVSMTPLQLGALVSAIANGGTLYYIQHPTSPEEVVNFQPRIKRTLDIGKLIPEIQDGMEAAVDYGTARSLRVNFKQFPVMGKTGTCSNNGTRYGWFASYADTQYGRIVTVFFLEGGRPTFGPKAAELTGVFYKDLWDKSYFTAKQPMETATKTAIGVNE